ncbi:MAG: hypothetical protein Q8O87_04320 [bacterium]|nr:hypothetical protein [bacterium]
MSEKIPSELIVPPERPEESAADQLERELTAFKAAVWKFKTMEDNREISSAHFHKLELKDLDDLTKRDGEIWEKLYNKTLTTEEYESYRQEVVASGSSVRDIFRQFIANKATIIFGRLELAELRKDRKKS